MFACCTPIALLFAPARVTRLAIDGDRRPSMEQQATIAERSTLAAPGRTVLLVEDERSIGRLVQAYLARDGFRVRWVASGEQALAELAAGEVTIVVLDIALPGVDGFEVCRRIRAHSEVPVVMLTARDEEEDRIAGLEAGADDYVPKPFSPRELAARLKAILRRTDPVVRGDRTLELAGVKLSRGARTVFVDGSEVAFTAKEFELLDCLFEHQGLVLTREQLLDRVWGGTFPGGTRTVDVHVAQVRRKLARPGLIQTVRGVGYKAVAP